MNQIIMACMAFGAILGGVDRILNNRFGLGEKFEEGFMLLGPLALSMPGIICLVPAISSLLATVLTPLCSALHLDPGTFGGILAIDMGGYQLAEHLAQNPSIGRFAGIILSATFGCTVIFTIPVGMSLIPENARHEFLHGILIGLMVLPLALLAGGLVQKMSPGELLQASFPILVLAAVLCVGMTRIP
ncbi:MAG: ethanolamine utilization protein EutH [Clostridia bacterium]|nr:ethanolamine utilization protein EutH [Clostridia bacterium]